MGPRLEIECDHMAAVWAERTASPRPWRRDLSSFSCCKVDSSMPVKYRSKISHEWLAKENSLRPLNEGRSRDSVKLPRKVDLERVPSLVTA